MLLKIAYFDSVVVPLCYAVIEVLAQPGPSGTGIFSGMNAQSALTSPVKANGYTQRTNQLKTCLCS